MDFSQCFLYDRNMNKKDARRYGLKQRHDLSLEIRKEKSKSIFQQLLPYLNKYNCIGSYVSIRDEVDTKDILDWCFEHHKKICVPKVVGRTLVFYEIHDWCDLEEGSFHVLEPKTSELVEVSDIELMLVPLSAFDKEHNRCGYGKGYYDSVLNECSKKIGLAFKEQEVDEITCEEFDVPLDDILIG